MTLDLSIERLGVSFLLLFSVTVFLFWLRRRARIEIVPRAQLLFACAIGVLYGLFRIWAGCGLVLPDSFR